MRPAEFIIWLKGFVAASNNYNLTPAGWETLKEELAKVNVVSPCSGHAFESDQHEEYDIEKLEGKNSHCYSIAAAMFSLLQTRCRKGFFYA